MAHPPRHFRFLGTQRWIGLILLGLATLQLLCLKSSQHFLPHSKEQTTVFFSCGHCLPLLAPHTRPPPAVSPISALPWRHLLSNPDYRESPRAALRIRCRHIIIIILLLLLPFHSFVRSSICPFVRLPGACAIASVHRKEPSSSPCTTLLRSQ